MEDDVESEPLEEIEADGNKDQATDSRKNKSKREDKLSSCKLNRAMDDYDAWFWKIVALRTHTKPQDSYLKLVIANHCKTEQDTKEKKMVSVICHQNCMELAAKYLD